MLHFLVSLLVSYNAFATDVVLKGINTSVVDGKAKIVYSFDGRIDARKVSVDYINDTVQIDLPNAYLEEKKRFNNVEDEKIKNLYSYQLDKDTLRLRVNYMPGTNASVFQGNVKTQFEGNQFTVWIDDGRIPLKTVDTKLPEKKSITVVSVDDFTSNEPQASEEISPEAEVQSQELAKSDETEEVLTEASTLDESKIPVLQKASENDNSRSGSFAFRLIGSFGLLAIFGLGMYVVSRRWSKTKFKNPHTHIKVLTQHYLGPKKSLAIISVAGESILVGITETNINLIKELSLLDDEIPTSVPSKFDESFAEADRNLEQDDEDESGQQENFSISGIKDVVKSRLKTMRDL